MAISILVVEDDDSMRLLLSRILERAGYEVHGVDNGLAALKAVDAGHFHLVISDIMMPEVDGLTLVEGLRHHATTRNMPIIFVSASEDPVHFAESVSLKARHFISKPFNSDKLLKKVASVVGAAGAAR